MNYSESISFQMDTTSDSIDTLGATNSLSPSTANVTTRKHTDRTKNGRLSLDDDTTRLPPDKIIVVDETPPSSSPSSSITQFDDHSESQQQTEQSQQQQQQQSMLQKEFAPLASTSSQNQTHRVTFDGQQQEQTNHIIDNDNVRSSKKSVLFDTVTVYHFNRSQGFVSIPSEGGATLGMKRRHFLRRRLKVDLYEEVRRRSRREILLKIKFDKRKREEQQLCDERLDNGHSTSSSTSSNTNTSDSDDESYSDFSDISDSELEIDSYIFLQPVGVKLRRSLLRASGVGRIDPKEKKECRTIRESRERSGCKCVDHCIPEYCECNRLGVNCHVDRASYPCGCISSGCQNPHGRTEFDSNRVRGHFKEKVVKSDCQAGEFV